MQSLKLIPAFLVLFGVFVTTDAFSQDESFQKTIIVSEDVSFWNAVTSENVTGSLDFQVTTYYDENGDLTIANIILLPGFLLGENTGDLYQATGSIVSFRFKNSSKTYLEMNLKVKLMGDGSEINIQEVVMTQIMLKAMNY